MVADYNRDQFVYVESEWPHREIRRERLTEKDRQLSLFDTRMSPAAPQAEESAAPVDAPEEATSEPSQESKVFFGVRDFDEDTDDAICFEVHYGDEDDTVVEFFVPMEYVINEGKDGDYPDDDERRYIEISVPHAIELGIIEAPEADDAQVDEPVENEPAAADADGGPEAEAERSCGTCGHLNEAPEGDEPSPCADCGQDPDLPNWTDEYHVPADGQEPQPATMQ